MCERPRGLEGEVSTHSDWGNYWWVYPEWQPGDYGEWMIEISGESGSGSVEGHFLFAEDCSLLEEEEFVPEPGAIVLLGSGLVGLPGYAALHWRDRKV